jgi:hypothetical protein
MAITPEARTRFSALINGRRLDLGLTWRQVAALAGISYESLRAVRDLGAGPPRQLTLRGIDRALQWEPGSAELALYEGAEPSALPAEHSPRPALAAVPPPTGPEDDRPQAVRDNPDDLYVQRLWSDDRIPADGREALIADYLLVRDRASAGPLARVPPAAALARFTGLAQLRQRELLFTQDQIAARAGMPRGALAALYRGTVAELREGDLAGLDRALYWEDGSSARVLYENGDPSPLRVRPAGLPDEFLRVFRASESGPAADPGSGANGT